MIPLQKKLLTLHSKTSDMQMGYVVEGVADM